MPTPAQWHDPKPGAALRQRKQYLGELLVSLFSPWSSSGPTHEMSWSGLLAMAAEYKRENLALFTLLSNFTFRHNKTENQFLVAGYRGQAADKLEDTNLRQLIAEENGVSLETVDLALEEVVGELEEDAIGQQQKQEEADLFVDETLKILKEFGYMESPHGLGPIEAKNPPETTDVAAATERLRQQQDKPQQQEDRNDEHECDELNPTCRFGEVREDHKIVLDDYSYIDAAGSVITLGRDQRCAADGVVRMLNGEQQTNHLGAPCEMRRAFFLLGGPGTGKSKVIDFLTQKLSGKNFKVTVLAPTGIAASINAGCKTIHSVLAIPVPLPAEYVPLSRADIVRLRSDVGKTCKLIVLDEVSMISREIMHWVDCRLQEIFGSDELFGGVSLLLAGDFFQIPPPGGSRLYSRVSPKAKTKRLEVCYFSEAYAYELHEQHRAGGDELHSRIVSLMRTDPRGAMKLFLENVKTLSPDDCADDEQHNSFASALLVVPSNAERHAINMAKAIAWATARGEVLAVWPGGGKMPPCAVEESLVQHPASWNAFLAGAPCVVNENVCQDVANGSLGTMKTLVTKQELCYTTTLLPNVLQIAAPKFVEVSVGINDAKNVLLKKRKYGGGGGGGGGRGGKNAGNFQYELGFSATFHKVQGITVDKIILDLARRPSMLGRLDFSAVYVALSRVRTLDGIRILPFRARGDNHLRKFEVPVFPLMSEAVWLSECTYRFGGNTRERK